MSNAPLQKPKRRYHVSESRTLQHMDPMDPKFVTTYEKSVQEYFADKKLLIASCRKLTEIQSIKKTVTSWIQSYAPLGPNKVQEKMTAVEEELQRVGEVVQLETKLQQAQSVELISKTKSQFQRLESQYKYLEELNFELTKFLENQLAQWHLATKAKSFELRSNAPLQARKVRSFVAIEIPVTPMSESSETPFDLGVSPEDYQIYLRVAATLKRAREESSEDLHEESQPAKKFKADETTTTREEDSNAKKEEFEKMFQEFREEMWKLANK